MVKDWGDRASNATEIGNGTEEKPMYPGRAETAAPPDQDPGKEESSHPGLPQRCPGAALCSSVVCSIPQPVSSSGKAA